MASHDINLMGAVFPNVPTVLLPVNGGGTAAFTDVSDTTAVASDVASGKVFYNSNGEQTTGTASGGGGTFTPVRGVIRPDATLMKTWTYDKKAVTDEKLTIPAFSGATVTLKESGQIESYSINLTDNADFDFYISERYLSIPIYSTNDYMKGKIEFISYSRSYEIAYVKANTFAFDGVSNGARAQYMVGEGAFTVYWHSPTTITTNNTTSYGLYLAATAYTTSLNGNVLTININSPSIRIRGNSTYFPQAVWNVMTDTRLQYIVELWKVPKDKAVLGNQNTSVLFSGINDMMNNNGTLR